MIMINRIGWTVFPLIALVLSGCVGNMNSIRHQFNVKNGKSQLIDVKQRGIFVGSFTKKQVETSNTGRTVVKTIEHPVLCAEPSPDAMSAYAAELAAKGGSEGKAYGELSSAMQESSSFVGMRTGSIQTLRDYGYRLCEAYMSGGINEIQYESLLRRYQKNMVTLFAIEQLSGVNRVPTIALVSQGMVGENSTLQSLETTKKSLINEVDLLKSSKEGKTTEEQTKIDSIISEKNTQIEGLDSSIKTLKGRGGSSNASIITIPTTTPVSTNTDETVKAIYKLTNSMLAADELANICISTLDIALSNSSTNAFDNEHIKTCKEYLVDLAKWNRKRLENEDSSMPASIQYPDNGL